MKNFLRFLKIHNYLHKKDIFHLCNYQIQLNELLYPLFHLINRIQYNIFLFRNNFINFFVCFEQYKEAASGSKAKNNDLSVILSINPAFTQDFIIILFCTSFKIAGTVTTHLILFVFFARFRNFFYCNFFNFF